MSLPSDYRLPRSGQRVQLTALVDEVRAAGQEALELAEQGAAGRHRKKADRSPVTEADERVEQRLRAWFSRELPEVAFLGEEEGLGESGSPKTPTVRAVVDPIDGTRAFIRGLDTWSVLVGIEEDQVPVVGVVYMPARDAMYVAAEGVGAMCNGRRLAVSACSTLDEALVAHGGLNQFAAEQQETLVPLLARRTYTQRCWGDFANYAALLAGQADGVVEAGLKPWDLCAVAVLVREAGGRITSFSGNPSMYEGSAVASSPRIHNALLALCQKAK